MCLLIFIVMITKVVANLNGTEFGPVGGSTLRQQIRSFYASIGGVAKSEFGDVLLDDKSVKSDLGHPNYRNKTCSFAAVKDVLEKGIMTKPMAHYGIHGKKQETGIISANIMIKGQPFKMDVVVIKNEDEILRVRCHDVYQTTLTENHHKGLITKRIRRTLIESPSCCPNGDLSANVEKNTEITKDNNIKEEKYTYMKKLIRLAESDLHRIVKESVKRVLREQNEKERYDRIYNFCNTEIYWENVGHNLDNPHDFADLVKYIASKTNEDYDFCYDVLADYVQNNPDVYDY